MVDLLIRSIADLNLNPGRADMRNLLELSSHTQKLAQSQEIRSLVEQILGNTARVVRGIFFDKQSDANWKVPWHQDRTIAVKNRVEVPVVNYPLDWNGIPDGNDRNGALGFRRNTPYA